MKLKGSLKTFSALLIIFLVSTCQSVSAINVTTEISDLSVELPNQTSTSFLSFPSFDNKLYTPKWAL